MRLFRCEAARGAGWLGPEIDDSGSDFRECLPESEVIGARSKIAGEFIARASRAGGITRMRSLRPGSSTGPALRTRASYDDRHPCHDEKFNASDSTI
jgi:hypothetical protein